MILADKIIEERKKNGWSQEELAERLGVSRQAVSKWESAGSVPDLQKVIQLSKLFGVSTDYLLKDELAPEAQGEYLTAAADSELPVYRVTMEEANDFIALRKKSAGIIAAAVTLCILSPALLIILAALSESGLYNISENFAAGVGCTVLFAMIAAAVFMFITCGVKLGESEHLEKINFETEYGVTGMVNEKKRAFSSKFAVGIAAGVVLCVVSAVPVIISSTMEAPEHITACMVSLLLLMIAAGVNIIIRTAVVMGSYDTLLQEGDYTRREKGIRAKQGALGGIYWCIATAIYLGWSFWTMRWDFTWIVWPVAGVLFAVVGGISRMIILSKNAE